MDLFLPKDGPLGSFFPDLKHAFETLNEAKEYEIMDPSIIYVVGGFAAIFIDDFCIAYVTPEGDVYEKSGEGKHVYDKYSFKCEEDLRDKEDELLCKITEFTHEHAKEILYYTHASWDIEYARPLEYPHP
jgi:hypothetical protein